MSTTQPAGPGRQLAEANRFVVDGPVTITYDRTSITGRPLFSYRDAERQVNIEGDDIHGGSHHALEVTDPGRSTHQG